MFIARQPVGLPVGLPFKLYSKKIRVLPRRALVQVLLHCCMKKLRTMIYSGRDFLALGEGRNASASYYTIYIFHVIGFDGFVTNPIFILRTRSRLSEEKNGSKTGS